MGARTRLATHRVASQAHGLGAIVYPSRPTASATFAFADGSIMTTVASLRSSDTSQAVTPGISFAVAVIASTQLAQCIPSTE